MLNKLSRKDIELLNILAQTPEGKSALDEYIEQHEKAVKAYKVYRESVVAEVEVDKVVKPVEPKRKFKVGDKVRVLVKSPLVSLSILEVGDITEVVGYKRDFEDFVLHEQLDRPVIVRDSAVNHGFFEESALELVEEKTPNKLRAEVIQRAKEFVKEYADYPLLDSVIKISEQRNKRKIVASVISIKNMQFTIKEVVVKTHPDDVYNFHIGKAIAIGRLLGKDVSEFENAVQPTVAIGQEIEVVSSWTKQRTGEFLMVDGFRECGSPTHDNGTYTNFYKITNDTNAQYGGIE